MRSESRPNQPITPLQKSSPEVRPTRHKTQDTSQQSLLQFLVFLRKMSWVLGSWALGKLKTSSRTQEPRHKNDFETGPEGPELEGQQVDKKSKAAQTKPKKLIRRTCPSGHGSDGSSLEWHAPPCSESAAQKKSIRFPQVNQIRDGL